MKIHTRLLALLAVLAFVAAACSGDDAASTTYSGFDAYGGAATTVAATTTTAAAEASAGRDLEGDDSNAAPIGSTPTPAELGRSIVYTATIEVEVDDVIAAGVAAQQAVAPLGGLLFGQDTTTGPNPRSTLIIKVRPEDFQEALARLSGIGTLVSQSVSAEDVTERVVDLQSRITTAEASVERLRTFLSQATQLKDVADLEAELLQRETDLELLRGQLRTVEAQVDLATITIILTEPTPDPRLELTQTAYTGHDGGAACPGTSDLPLDEGDAATYCYELMNSGDTGLADIELRDGGFDAKPEDFIVVEGDPAAILSPGDRIILALETAADPAEWSAPSVSATAVDADGSPLRVAVGMSEELASVSVARDTSLPGFGDAMRASWHGLQRVFGVALVVAGAVVPFLWLPLLLGLVAIWMMRRRSTTSTTPAEPPQD
jgi:hypothetical protein